MTHKIADDELRGYVERVSKPDLIAWLLERCHEDEKLRASLLDLVTPQENTEALAYLENPPSGWLHSRQNAKRQSHVSRCDCLI